MAAFIHRSASGGVVSYLWQPRELFGNQIVIIVFVDDR
jgi:hypothetical protein